MPVGAVVGGAALVGGVMQSNAASDAADAESKAAMNAAGLSQQAFGTAKNYLSPYVTAGQQGLSGAQAFMGANNLLNGSTSFAPGQAGIPYATSTGAFSFNPSDLSKTPGYQFQLEQGSQAVNNALAASGLNVSGAQAKALGSYVTGLADTTYNQQFNNALNAYTTSYGNALNAFNTNYNVASQQYGRYMGQAQLGESAGNALANAAVGTAGTTGQAIMGAGQANAAGAVGQANAWSNALNGAAGGYLAGNMLTNYGGTNGIAQVPTANAMNDTYYNPYSVNVPNIPQQLPTISMTSG